MHGFSEHKSKKIIRVNLEYDKTIQKIDISGDFFIYPEDSLQKIERELIGFDLTKKDNISKLIKEFMHKHQIELIGINADDIEKAIKEATKATEKAFEPHLKK